MRRPFFIANFALLVCGLVAAEPQKGFYRYPALHGDTVVFAAEGDLWSVGTAGGVARRLTTHPGEESHPRISPDGSVLAFTGRYEGPVELYTMPVDGGLPVRRSYEAESSRATTWTPGGKLVYTTTHYATLPNPQLVALDIDTGVRERIPLSQATEGCYDASGQSLYFVRPAFHRNVTKRYKGGTARKIWKFTAGADEAVVLTADYAGESHSPMWWRGRVYFVSDRDGTMNVWSIDEGGADARQHTRHSGWDVKRPSLENGRIVYELAADLRLYDIRADNDRLLDIYLASDFDQLREKWVTEPMEYLTSAHIHPEGESVVLTARGRVFVAPAKGGRFRRAAREPGIRYRNAVFMPDGENLLAVSDGAGELEFVRIPADGIGAPSALTDDGAVLRFEGVPSPDGSFIAYTDNNADLWLFEIATKNQRLVSTNREGVRGQAWSPDGRYLAYVQTAVNTYAQIHLYDVSSGERLTLTSDRVNSMSPTWSPDGKWVYFLSDRNLASVVGSPWGPRQPEAFFDKPMKIYQIALARGNRSPFKPIDELDHEDDAEGEADDEVSVIIDRDGLARRVREVPVPPGSYRALRVSAEALYFMAQETGRMAPAHLMAVALEADAEPERIVENVRSYELARDGKKILVRKEDELYVVDASTKPIDNLNASKIDLSTWSFTIDPREDWRQIFVDAWRLERDYFYDPGMHSVDWENVLEKYSGLVDRVTTREELSDLIGRLVGELSALHTSVRGGDQREGQDDVELAGLGARLVRSPAEGGYRIDYIYQGDPDYPDELAPLADPDIDVAAGDVIVAVNGVDVLSVRDIGALLRNQAGKQVLVGVKSPGGAERNIIVVPTDGESALRYSDWEVTRRLEVEEKGAGALGYVHLRAMTPRDLNAWYRQFYPVFNRQGLILDMRRNRGGNIDSLILEKLMRPAWFYWKSRVGEPTWNMQYAFRGHMVMLVDENTASDGEAVAEGFRRLGLGKLIGTRTWGGEIWLSSTNRLSDGGIARAPMSGVYGPEGEWLIEGHGVEPDIVVDNLPHATFEGEDAQLDAAIAYLLEQIEKDPRPVPNAPAYPDMSFEYPTVPTSEGAK